MESFDREKMARVAAAWSRASSAAIEAAGNLGYKPFLPMRTIVDVTGACEQIPTLYSVDHYGARAFLAQSGQLDLEMATRELGRVWTVIPSSRREAPGGDDGGRRRLSQFTLFEIEFANAEGLDNEGCLDELIAHLTAVAGSAWSAASGKEFRPERITYGQALAVLSSALGFGPMSWGDDLTAAHEKALCEYAGNRPVFVTHYPRSIKFFNMKSSGILGEDSVLSTDLLLPGVGESVGAAVRETDPNLIVANLLGSDMYKMARSEGVRDEDFAWYVNEHCAPAFRREDPLGFVVAGGSLEEGDVAVHSGAGIGMNRLVQSALGLDDIREATPFPVTPPALVAAGA